MCLFVHSLPLSLPPSLLCPFLFKSRQGSFEGPEGRPWRGARRKGCGRPHCSTLLCCADSDTSSLRHTHHITHKIGHTLCVESLTPVFTLPSLERRILLVSGLSILSMCTDNFVFHHVSEAHQTPGSHGVKGQEETE